MSSALEGMGKLYAGGRQRSGDIAETEHFAVALEQPSVDELFFGFGKFGR